MKKLGKRLLNIHTVIAGGLLLLGILGASGYAAIQKKIDEQAQHTTEWYKSLEELNRTLNYISAQFESYTKLHPDAPAVIQKAGYFIAIQKLRELQGVINSGTIAPEKLSSLFVELQKYIPAASQESLDKLNKLVWAGAMISTEALLAQLYASGVEKNGGAKSQGLLGYVQGVVKVNSVANLELQESQKKWVADIADMLHRPQFISCAMTVSDLASQPSKTIEIVMAEIKNRVLLNCYINELINQIMQEP